MACSHPLPFERIYQDGKLVGGRCPACGDVAYKGESFWATFKRNVLRRHVAPPQVGGR